MLEEDKDNLYVYEETDEIQDDSPMNFASSQFEEENSTDEEEKEEKIKRNSCFGILIKIMFNPVAGWKSLRRKKITVEEFQSGLFYPLLALVSISKFADYFYSVNVTLTGVVTKAVIAFVSFFFGYFCILFVLSKILPKNLSPIFEGTYGKEYVIAGLSTLALFGIITDILPMLWPVLIFLPLWTLYLLYQGSRFFQLATSQELRFLIMTCATIIGVPYVIDWGLNELLPY